MYAPTPFLKIDVTASCNALLHAVTSTFRRRIGAYILTYILTYIRTHTCIMSKDICLCIYVCIYTFAARCNVNLQEEDRGIHANIHTNIHTYTYVYNV